MYMVLASLHYIPKLVEYHMYHRKKLSVKLRYVERKIFYIGLGRTSIQRWPRILMISYIARISFSRIVSNTENSSMKLSYHLIF